MEKLVKEYTLRTYECDKNGYLRVVTLPNSKQILTMFPCYSIDSDEDDMDDIQIEKVKKL